MSLPRFGIPPVVRNKALSLGAAAWIDDLPELVRHLEREWQLTVGRSYDSATEALVAEATRGDGTPVVLKLMIPRPGAHAKNAITFLRLAGGEAGANGDGKAGADAGGKANSDAGGNAGGDGCVRLLRSDESLGALLLERLGRSLDQLGLPIGQRHEILCATAARVWRPAPGCGLPTGAEHGRFLTGFITRTWTEFGRPCSARAVDYALACAGRRIDAHDDERAVLVHGDVHQWNVLEAAGGYKLVDPNGMLAEAELDLGIVMREDPVELMHGDPHERARWLARRCGLDATAIWEWGVVERVSTGLLLTKVELQPVGHELLAAADRVASEYTGQ
jgi:streptomycin 6-kinase